MVIATMAAVISNEHEMEREKKSSQIWQFSCHKELEVGINRHHRPLTNCAKSTFFPGFKINKIQIKKSLGKCKMELFYCQKTKTIRRIRENREN